MSIIDTYRNDVWNREKVERFLKNYGFAMAEFEEDHGYSANYSAETVLIWLGY